MIYLIRENAEPYSFHLTEREAQEYLADLRLVYPASDWEFEPQITGRLPTQSCRVWGAECLVDALDHSIHQFMKIHTWTGDRWNVPTLGVEMYRYIPMTFDMTTTEHEAKPIVARRLRGLEFELRANDMVIRVI